MGISPNSFHWSDERIEELKQHVIDGLSFAEIARAMGCASRNVPLCKFNRLKAAAEAAGTPLHHPKLRMGGKLPAGVVRTPKPKPQLPAPAPAPGEPEALMLDGAFVTEENCPSRGCRYPHGDPGTPEFHYCGQPKKGGGSSYCEHHHSKVYVSHERYKNRTRGQRAA